MNNQKKIAYLISNIEEYGKFLSFLINNDFNVYRLYWDERTKCDRCYQIDWKEKDAITIHGNIMKIMDMKS